MIKATDKPTGVPLMIEAIAEGSPSARMDRNTAET